MATQVEPSSNNRTPRDDDPEWLHEGEGGSGSNIQEPLIPTPPPLQQDVRHTQGSGRNSRSAVPFVSEEADDHNLPSWARRAPSKTRHPPSTTSRYTTRKNKRRRRRWAAWKVVNLLTSLIACAAIWSNTICIYQSSTDYYRNVLRVYAIILSILTITTETGFCRHTSKRSSALLDCWVFRGFFYSLVGVLTMTNFDDWSIWYEKSIGIAFISVGLIYFVMGLLCLDRLKRQQEEEDEGLGT